jgi:hypothetical protein
MIEEFPKLDAWHDFYVMVGSGAAALTGLLFVLVSLGPHVVADRTETGVKGFISPIAVHFTAAMVTAAAMLAPDIPAPILGSLLVIGSIGGIVYMLWTRVHAQWRRNHLSLLDLVWFVALPLLAFLITLGSGVGIALHARMAPYALATGTVMLIVIGIRNAWDIVVWMTKQPRP